MLKKYVIKMLKQNIFTRYDDNGCLYYFSVKDFPELKYESYNFISSKGHILKGSFYYYDNYKTNHIVIFDHGMGGGHLSYFKEIELLTKYGFLVFSYDHTGCMESGGENTSGFSQSLCDLNDCINSFKNHEIYKNYTFSVIGHSWGAFSTMNIPYFHNDVKHIVAISGFISVKDILKQNFNGLLSNIYKDALKLEEESNPEIVNINAFISLKNYEGKALIIHSKDDNVVNYKRHCIALKNKLSYKNNIQFMLLNKKKHNPNYTEDAVKYKGYFFKRYTKLIKNNKLNTIEQKKQFIKSYDWNRMTMQDNIVWKEIFKVLDNE